LAAVVLTVTFYLSITVRRGKLADGALEIDVPNPSFVLFNQKQKRTRVIEEFCIERACNVRVYRILIK
jgi:hypothetical protein